MSSTHPPTNGHTSTAATLAKSPHAAAAAAAAKAGAPPRPEKPRREKKTRTGPKLSMDDEKLAAWITASMKEGESRAASHKRLRESGKSCSNDRFNPAWEKLAKTVKVAPAPKAEPEKKAEPKAAAKKAPAIKPLLKPKAAAKAAKKA